MEEKKLETGELPPKKKKKRKKLSPYFVAPFFVAMAMLTVLAFIIPLRPTQSYGEKRNLAKFPEFSVEALASGDYFDGITLWFADTYPGRDTWLSVSAYVEELHGYSDVVIHGELQKGDEIPTVATKPPTEPTEAVQTEPQETTAATTAPTGEATEPTEETIRETIEAPTTPVEEWGGVDAGDDGEIIFGSVLQIGDSAFDYFGFSQYWSDYYADGLNGLADFVADYDVQVVSALIPSAVGVMVEPEYMEKIECSDQGAAIDYMLSVMNDKVIKVDMFQNLVDHNDEYIYFRTDHHWTAMGAYYCYEDICKALGMEPAPLSVFEERDMGVFEGSLYWQCYQSSKLRLDNVYAYDPPGNLEMWITNSDGGTFQWPVLTDMSESDESSKYMTFIAGDNPMTEIINHDIPDAPKCVLVKDSFGNPLAPYLTQNFSTVYVLDFRKYGDMDLRTFVQRYDVDYIIFGHMLGMAQSEGANSLFSWLCS